MTISLARSRVSKNWRMINRIWPAEGATGAVPSGWQVAYLQPRAQGQAGPGMHPWPPRIEEMQIDSQRNCESKDGELQE